MYEISLQASFPFAHSDTESVFQARDVEISVAVQGENLDALGMLYDFANLKALVKKTLAKLELEWQESRQQVSHERLLKSLVQEAGGTLPDGLRVSWVAVKLSGQEQLRYFPER